MLSSSPSKKPGYLLLELMPVLSVLAALALIVLLAINPKKQFQEARNIKRRTDITQLADVFASHAREEGRALLLQAPLTTGSGIEICGDTVTGSCANLLPIGHLRPTFITTIPIDPTSTDPDIHNEHTRYFLKRTSGKGFTISAPNAEPVGTTVIEVSE